MNHDTMTVQEAEDILDFYRSRENARRADDLHDWEVAYDVALNAHRERANMHINGVPV